MKISLLAFALATVSAVTLKTTGPSCGCDCGPKESPIVLGNTADLDGAILDRTLKNFCKLSKVEDKIEDLCEKIDELGAEDPDTS